MLTDVPIYARKEIESVFNDYIVDKYDFEIDLDPWQKILIFVLNIFTGGLGILLLPFLNKKRKNYQLFLQHYYSQFFKFFIFYIFSPY